MTTRDLPHWSEKSTVFTGLCQLRSTKHTDVKKQNARKAEGDAERHWSCENLTRQTCALQSQGVLNSEQSLNAPSRDYLSNDHFVK